LSIDVDIAAAVEREVHASLFPNLAGKENVVDVANAGQVAGDQVGAGTGNEQQVASASVGQQRFQRSEIGQVGFVETERGLGAIEFDLVGIDPLIDKVRRRAPGQEQT